MNIIKRIAQKIFGKTAPAKAQEPKTKWTKKTYNKNSKNKNSKNKEDFSNNKKPRYDNKDKANSGNRRSPENRDRNPATKRARKELAKPTSNVKPQEPTAIPMPEDTSYQENAAKFKDLGIIDNILAAISDMSYSEPTEIQTKAIPEILNGKDIIATAQTGTGKTAAFALPILQNMKEHKDYLSTLILAPTRELATQINDAINSYCKYTPLRSVLVVGGVSKQKQLDGIAMGADIIVGTPGRVLDYIRGGEISLKKINYLILDEVDRMFDMGFIDDVSYIIRSASTDRQTLFFSATMPDSLVKLSKWALVEPVRIDIGVMHKPAETVDHCIYPIDRIQKYDLLLEILENNREEKVIIFTRTKVDADMINARLEGREHKSCTMHSDRSQKERDQALKAFKNDEVRILVATDIASRGLDISAVSLVINYNVPEHSEDYVHRIGRTGRAKSQGSAITLYSSDEVDFLRRIERFIGAEIPRRKLDTFNYTYEPELVTAKKVRRRNR